MLTPHPYFTLFKHVNNILGPIFMDGLANCKNLDQVIACAIPLFEIASHNISSW